MCQRLPCLRISGRRSLRPKQMTPSLSLDPDAPRRRLRAVLRVAG